MANLGNVGKWFKGASGSREYSAWQFFTLNKQPTSVDMAGTGVNASAIPFSFVTLVRNATLQYQTRADASGNWHFYDMDNSGSQVYAIASYTQNGATGEAWTATVVGSVATVTKTFAANRASASFFA